jgi:hypothetical protein
VTRYRYSVYGLGVASDAPLALPAYVPDRLGDVECVTAPAAVPLAEVAAVDADRQPGTWYHHMPLRDGSTYVRWDGIGEFVVAADGRRITCRQLDASSVESFQVYMLGQALSFALIKQCFEPLHATAVVVDGQAVAFLGSNAFGKSSLAACFLEAGHQLLTDDLLILQPSPKGVLAYPGPPRIKLFRGVARRFLGEAGDRGGMNEDTDKLIVPIDGDRRCSHPVRLNAIYTLAAPRDACRRPDVSIEPLSAREVFVELIKGTFNRRLVSRQRLERQFRFVGALTEHVAMRKLIYPRTIDRLPEVRTTLLADLVRTAGLAAAAPVH